MKAQAHVDFAVIETILVLVIIAMIGGTGYFVWQAKQNTDKTLSDTANSQPGIVKVPKVTDFAGCKAAKGSVLQEAYPEKCITKEGMSFTDINAAKPTYLMIKELGIKIPLDSTTADLSYSWFASGYADLTSKQLTDKVGQLASCSDYKSVPYEVGIVYAAGAYEASSSAKQQSQVTVTGKTYYLSSSGHAGRNCPNTTPSVDSEVSTYLNTLILSFRSSIPGS